jgi:hypothetical protein
MGTGEENSESLTKPSGGHGGGIGFGVRSALSVLQKQVTSAAVLSEQQAADNVRFAMAVRDDPLASHRDRLRAMELIESMIARGINVAMYMDKNDRLDSGKLTENAGLTFNLIPVDPPEVPNQSTQEG